MRQVLFFSIIVALILQACKKTPVSNPPLEPTKPAMVYKNLKNAIVSVGHPKTIDIENDGISDFGFGVMLVGDPILQRDRLQFYVNSKVDRNLLNDEQDQSPMLNRSAIVSSNFPGYSWYQISHILLAEKITNFSGSSWDGLWKNASHHYLPIQIKKNRKIYNGWIELSFDMTGEQLILHKAALSIEEDMDVRAGI